MKRILVILIVLCIAVSFAFSDDYSKTGTVKDSTETKDTATLGYSIDLKSVDSYEIGFSKGEVKDFTSTITQHNRQYPLTLNGTTATTGDDIYVYWRIHSATPCTIKLTASSLKHETEEDYVNMTLSTTKVDDGIVSVSGHTPLDPAKTSGAQVAGNTIYNFQGHTDDYLSAGSQKVTLVSDSLKGHTAGIYSGAFTLSIDANT